MVPCAACCSGQRPTLKEANHWKVDRFFFHKELSQSREHLVLNFQGDLSRPGEASQDSPRPRGFPCHPSQMCLIWVVAAFAVFLQTALLGSLCRIQPCWVEPSWLVTLLFMPPFSFSLALCIYPLLPFSWHELIFCQNNYASMGPLAALSQEPSWFTAPVLPMPLSPPVPDHQEQR